MPKKLSEYFSQRKQALFGIEDKVLLTGLLFLAVVALSGCAISQAPLLKVQQKESDIGHKISMDDLATIEDLFNKNNLNLGDFQIYEFGVSKNIPDNPQAMYYSVEAYQVYKKLPVFFGDVIYGFNKEDIKVYEAGTTKGRLISNIGRDISITLTITKEDAALKVITEKGDAGFDQNNLMAELGLYNKNIGSADKDADYVLVWKVTTKNSSYPYAIVDATNGQILFFDTGIRDLASN